MSNPFESILIESRNPTLISPRIRSGERPEFRFEFRDNWTFTRHVTPSLVSAKDFLAVPFDCDLAVLAKKAGRALKSFEADFMWLAMAVYLADRFAERSPYGPTGRVYWRRRIHVTVPVSDRKLWNGVEKELLAALTFLTEDDWSFEFVEGRRPFNEEDQDHFRQLTPLPIEWAALFSGGLDSAAGAVNWLQRTQGRGLLVSGQTNGRIAVSQREQVAELRTNFATRIDHIGISYGVPDKTGMEGIESSQRTRAFVHVMMGSLSAAVSGTDKLMLFENGFGALNLACDSAQIGSQNSRGTHPVFLRRMGAFVSGIFGKPFTIENPYVFSTKAEMLSVNEGEKFSELFKKSFSCDRFPNYPHKAPQCGRCASCLVRRMSFHAAGLPDEPRNYTFDIFAGKPLNKLRDIELLAQVKMTVQSEIMSERLNVSNAWARLGEIWPELLRAESELGLSNFSSATITLLKKHVREWQSFTRAAAGQSISAAA